MRSIQTYCRRTSRRPPLALVLCDGDEFGNLRHRPEILGSIHDGCDTGGGRNDIGNNQGQEHLEDPFLRDLAGNDGVPVINRDEEGPNH